MKFMRIYCRLYDLNGDGVIQKDEMQDVALAVSIVL